MDTNQQVAPVNITALEQAIKLVGDYYEQLLEDGQRPPMNDVITTVYRAIDTAEERGRLFGWKQGWEAKQAEVNEGVNRKVVSAPWEPWPTSDDEDVETAAMVLDERLPGPTGEPVEFFEDTPFYEGDSGDEITYDVEDERGC